MERKTPTDHLTIGEVAARAGIATSAIRFYEQEGLITSVRTAGNQRRYPRHTLRRLSIIGYAKRLGIPLTEVAAVFETLPADRMPSKRDWMRISARWAALLDERKRRIKTLQQELSACIGCGCLSLSSCNALNPGDVLAKQGSGPVRLEEAAEGGAPAGH
ncbi:redox-sensitive transcriptional activator SoxR [Leucobacter aridicollis]|uniref:redox-sensitive transcriptional activator SoxR n=1 Tax=Leucobacter aridicollis TaxID=283878 RepID=UPI00216A27C8|nr:redox-sensitive transcriptional activator SoxR [Leucobacter aridicollis]MCS3426892.1 MerR family redox-sensitive transcriptional activator SoxR [Leucobacter aridicollis]